MFMRFYVISGEASGDLHGSLLMRALRQPYPKASFRVWGGEKMQAEGGELVKHYRDLAFMGFIEVIFNLRTILRNLSYCRKDILLYKPDALILVDYPGFNLRMAQWAKSQGIPVIYYISPQVWAWKESRVKKMKETIDRMIVILPFEKDYFEKKWNWRVYYVGHPLVNVIDDWKKEAGDPFPATRPVVALLPGSRKQEIMKKLPVMLLASRRFPDCQFIIARAPGIDEAFYDALISAFDNVSLVSGKTYELLNQAKAAVVTSGTATLETALFGVPQVVCYKASPISYQIGRRLVKVPFISLVNLIMNRTVVKELIQDAMNPDQIAGELDLLLNDEGRRRQIRADYHELRKLLKTEGHAADNAARVIHDLLTSAVSPQGSAGTK